MARANGTYAAGGEGAEALLSTPDSRARGGNLLAAAQELPQRIEKVNEQFVAFVQERPLVAVGAAVAVGYVLGRIFRRVF